MTLWSDLVTDLGDLITKKASELVEMDDLIALQRAPVTLPVSFADLTAYTTYLSDLATYEGNLSTAQSNYDAARADTNGALTTIIGRIPVVGAWFKITVSAVDYAIRKNMDEEGNYSVEIRLWSEI